MDWDKNEKVRVGKNSGPVLSRLWTKVRVVLRRRGTPCSLQRTWPLVYIVFHSEDIGR